MQELRTQAITQVAQMRRRNVQNVRTILFLPYVCWCILGGTTHKEIFSFKRITSGTYENKEWKLIVQPVIERWGDFVSEHVWALHQASARSIFNSPVVDPKTRVPYPWTETIFTIIYGLQVHITKCRVYRYKPPCSFCIPILGACIPLRGPPAVFLA